MNNRNINIPDGFNQREPRRYNFWRNIMGRNDRIVPVEEGQVQRGNPQARRIMPLDYWNAERVNAERPRILTAAEARMQDIRAQAEQVRRRTEEARRQAEEARRRQTLDYLYGRNTYDDNEARNVRPPHFSYRHYLVEPGRNPVPNPVIGELFHQYFIPTGILQVEGIRNNDDIADVIGEVVGQDNHRLRRY